MNPVVASDKLKRAEVWGEDDESVHWAGAFAVYGGHGATASSTIVYEIEPGKRLGWHTLARATGKFQSILRHRRRLRSVTTTNEAFSPTVNGATGTSDPAAAGPRGCAVERSGSC